jgi:DHA1 family bicyclomycin/chloramphenicol resistance-like MFS transporter
MSLARSPLFIVILVAVTAIAPFSMQMFLPALPVIQVDFGISQDLAILTLTLSLFAIAFGNFVYGPLSDRLGRKPILLAGLLIFLAGSIIAALAQDIWILIGGRLLQGGGGAAGLVLARAMVRDVYGASRAARAISYLTMAMVFAPMFAPMVGGLLTDAIHWRAVFAFVAVLIMPVLIITWLRLEETAPVTGAAAKGVLVAGIRRLSRSARFWGFTISSSLSIAIFFAYVAATPFLAINLLGLSAAEYGLTYLFVAGCYICGNFMATRLHSRLGERGLMVFGSVGVAVVTCGAVPVYLTTQLSIFTLVAPAMLFSLFQGCTIPMGQAGAINVDARYAGAAAGRVGFLQMGAARTMAQLVADMADGTVWPLAITMVVLSLLAVVALPLMWIDRVDPEAAEPPEPPEHQQRPDLPEAVEDGA